MDGKPRVGATVHHAFNDLPQIWPDAKFIFIRRDPRDVARSCVQMGWSGTPWHGVDFWLDAEQAWSRLQLNIPEHQCLVLRFEDLVADSPGQLSRICRFLDIDYESGMLDIDADTTYSRPDPAAAKSWQDSASVDEVQQVETRIGLDVLTECGYQPSGHPLLTGSADSLRIYCQELIGRVTGKVRLYGFSLWMRGVISRRLPFTAWRERVQIMVDEVDNQNLK